jgi:YVTN family beta-propeller protein
MEFRILGPVRALDDGRPIPLGGHRQRALLAVLLVHANEPLSADRLADELWGEAASAQAAKRLQVSIHRLRRTLEGGRDDGDSHSLLVTDAGGYVLRLEPAALDRDRFEDLVQEGRRALADGDPGRASQVLGEALGLWRGPPLADVAYESFAQPEIARLQELQMSATEAHIDARLALGAGSELVPELEALIASHPLRERLHAQLMLALYRSGRQADALEVYRRAREMLHDELGLEPGTELRHLQQAILRHDPTIEVPSSAPRDRVRAPDPGMRKSWGILAGAAALAAATVAVLLTGATSSHPSPVPPNTLAEIDPRSDRVVGAVAVGARPGPIAFGDGALWVGNLDDDSVSRVDPRSRAVLRTVAVADSPVGLAAGAGGVWVAGSDDAVREIDPAFDSVTEIRQPSTGYLLSASLPSPVATGLGSVWIASRTAVVRFAPPGGRPSARVGVGLSPDGIAVGFGSAWIADSAENTVTRIDPATNLPITIGVGQGPAAIAAGAGAVWVADALENSVMRIDPIRRLPVATIRVGRSPTGIAVGAGGVWVANSGSGTVSRIDPVSNRVVATIDVGHSPSDIAVAGGRVWTSVQGDVAASVIPTLAATGGVARVDLQSDADLRSLDPALAASPDAW